MKFKFNNKYFRWGLTAFFVIAASITFYYFIFHSSNIKAGFNMVMGILLPIVFGLIIAYLLTPILNFLEDKVLLPLCDKLKIKETEKRKRLIRGIGILITAFLFVALIYGLFSMLVSQIVPSVQGLIENFDSYADNAIQWINKTLLDNEKTLSGEDIVNGEFEGFNLEEYISKTIDKLLALTEEWLNDIIPNTAAIIRTVSSSVLNVMDVLWDFVIGFIISIYVLASKERFAAQTKKITYALFEKNTANAIIRNFRFTHETFIGFLGGKVVDSMIIGVLCFIGTSLMRTPYAVLVSVVIGLTNIIPFFGPFLGAIPSAVLIFVVDPMHPLNLVYFAIFILALQQFDGNILGPKILGSSTGLSGFWVIFAITLFGGLFGVLGMIVGVPIFAVIYAAVKAIINAKLEQKSMPQSSAEYERVEYIDEEGVHLFPSEQKRPSRKPKKTEKAERAAEEADKTMDEKISAKGAEKATGEEMPTEDKDSMEKKSE